MPPCLIASHSQWFFDQFLAPALAACGDPPQVLRVDPQEGYPGLLQAFRQHQSEVLLTGWGSVLLPESFLEDCPSLKYVCHLTGEMRNVIPRSLIARGLLVTNWGDAISHIIAEAALYLVLSCLRQAVQCQMHMHLRQGWAEGAGVPRSLFERRVGLHGFGNIARQLALLLAPFHCRVSAYSPPVPQAIFDRFGVRREAQLERLFAENDLIVELEALTPQTVGMVDAGLLGCIPQGGVFVNVGRGKVVDQAALIELAKAGQVAIGLDVYAEEPLAADSPLRGLENVFLTPHTAGPTPDGYPILGRYALDNVRAYLEGRPLKSVIGLPEYDRIT
jgi:phosphoglycerate dehydrogenase-like enzyme